jgi:hypothetical protein
VLERLCCQLPLHNKGVFLQQPGNISVLHCLEWGICPVLQCIVFLRHIGEGHGGRVSFVFVWYVVFKRTTTFFKYPGMYHVCMYFAILIVLFHGESNIFGCFSVNFDVTILFECVDQGCCVCLTCKFDCKVTNIQCEKDWPGVVFQ